MLILDENISEIEVWRLREWRIAVRQIGRDLAKVSATDENLLAVLHRLKTPTFFTRDRDFWNPRLRHARYGLVFLDVPEREGAMAAAIRRFLRHRAFDTHAKRTGKVVRIHWGGLQVWELHGRTPQSLEWEEQ